MEKADRKPDKSIDRRTFLKRGLVAGAAAGTGAAIWAATSGGPATPPPNILVIVVDQLRFPQWFSPAAVGSPGLPPNLAALRAGSVSFERHYTASNDCTPARSTLLTGLYTHQTGCMITGGSTLDPGFPTWGTMLREHGYSTYWYGKWHLTHSDRRWNEHSGPRMLERYGFDGGTFPSPNGGPGQGWRVDPQIAGQFDRWFADHAGDGPWCTTVSLVNPHDISWWYAWSDRIHSERSAPSVVTGLPPNYETPEQLVSRRKPNLQRSLQSTSARSFGPVPFAGPAALPIWLDFLDLYVKLQGDVDENVGRVLRTLHANPKVAANTVIMFTSDHGEYAGSHGLRGKGASAYEEAIRVPLLVRDPRGILTRAHAHARTQLTSSVDVAPLLLTIASGSDAWRRERHYSQIAQRLDLARILREPEAPGRAHVLHATDEILTEFATEPYAASAPLHIAAMRTAEAKFATYSNWRPGTVDALERHQESELYDYRSRKGRLEIDNRAGVNALEDALRTKLQRAIADELHEPLPSRLHAAQARGFRDYYTIARRTARIAAKRRRARLEILGAPSLPPPRWEDLAMPAKLLLVIVIAAALALSACGGGGGAKTTSSSRSSSSGVTKAHYSTSASGICKRARMRLTPLIHTLAGAAAQLLTGSSGGAVKAAGAVAQLHSIAASSLAKLRALREPDGDRGAIAKFLTPLSAIVDSIGTAAAGLKKGEGAQALAQLQTDQTLAQQVTQAAKLYGLRQCETIFSALG